MRERSLTRTELVGREQEFAALEACLEAALEGHPRVGPAGATANVIAPGYIAGTDFFRDRLSPVRRGAHTTR